MNSPGPPKTKITRNNVDEFDANVSWYINPPNDFIVVGIGPPDAIGSESNTSLSNSSFSVEDPESRKGDTVLDKDVVFFDSDDSNGFLVLDQEPPPLIIKGWFFDFWSSPNVTMFLK